MPRLIATHLVRPPEVESFYQPRSDLLIERAHGGGTFTLDRGPFDRYERVVVISPESSVNEPGEFVLVTETTDYHLAIPIWGFLFARAVRRGLRSSDRDHHRWWMPPDKLDARAANALSLLCGFSMLAGYLGTLLTQTNTFFKQEFGSTDSQIGLMLAAVRIGAVLALVIVAVADRKGRRKLLLWSAVAGCVVTATGAFASDLALLGMSQTVARAFSTAVAVLVSIMAIEEMPAGSRAFAVSVLTACGALGAGIAVLFVAVCGITTWAWRILFVVPLLAVPIAIRLGRHLPETERFQIAPKHSVKPRWWHVPPGLNRTRLALLSASGLCLALFVIPASSFLNEYLRTERGFSAGTIAAFQLLTNTPGGIGIVVGGRLADRRGRRLIGAIGVTAGVGFTVAMYFVGGWSIWMFSILGSVLGAMAVPALGVYGPELFPTRARGWANGVINLAAVVGSALGLFLAGKLASQLSGLGPAMAVLSVGGVAVVAMVIFLYPETAAKELEDLNPDDSPLSREMLGLGGLDVDSIPERYARFDDDES
ncbi:MAG: MFS transporter [Actinomycetes bacterium]